MASGVADIGLVSPEWLQNSYDSVELDALLSQVEMPAPFFDEPAPTTTPTLREDAFATASTQELQRLLDKNTNKNTVKSTKTWVNRFETWQRVRGIAVSSYSDPSQLDVILQQFYAELRKEDGSEYQPDSLRVMLASLDRHFQEKGYSFSIRKDKAFEVSRRTLNGKAIELREAGLGKRKNRADALTEDDEEALWNSGTLGGESPTSLNHTMFYMLSQQFGTRGCQEHNQMRIEDLKFVSNPQTGESEYVEWTEGLTKTRQGGLVKQDRRVPQKLFSTGTERCPVKLLELLISKRPAHLRSCGPLYLTPLRKPRLSLWYSVQPVGENKIKTYMKTMANLAGIDKSGKRYTNHSVRKTTVRKLQKAGISNDKIAAITGHKSEQTLRDYAATDMEDHQKISNILSGKKSDTVALQSVERKVLQPISQQSAGLPSHCPPQFVFNNCTVYMGTSNSLSASTTMQAVHETAPRPCQKRARILDSDEEN